MIYCDRKEIYTVPESKIRVWARGFRVIIGKRQPQEKISCEQQQHKILHHVSYSKFFGMLRREPQARVKILPLNPSPNHLTMTHLHWGILIMDLEGILKVSCKSDEK